MFPCASLFWLNIKKLPSVAKGLGWYNLQMAEPKTKATNQDPKLFLEGVEPEQRREEGKILLELFQKITSEKPVMWGPSIIGFGKYHYKSQKSSQEGEWPLTGFSPRKQSLSLYIMSGNLGNTELFEKLGKHRAGKGCLYINKLSDTNMEVLAKMIKTSFDYMKKANNA